MNKIEIIKKAIEDKTGQNAVVIQEDGYVKYTVRDAENKYVFSGCIDDYLVDLLPLSSPAEQPDKGWISVETSLPEKGQRVLTMTDYGGYDVCYIRGDGQWTNSMRPQHTNGSVTHWQKLPSAPVKQG